MGSTPSIAEMRRAADDLIAKCGRGQLDAIESGAIAASVSGTPFDGDESAQSLITACQPIIDQAETDAKAIGLRYLLRYLAAMSPDKTPVQVATIASLRSLYSKSEKLSTNQILIVGGYNSNGDGGGGLFWYDSTDTTSVDNGFNVIVSTAGGMRYKRIIGSQVTPMMWGARGDGTGDDSAALLAAILYCKTSSLTLDGLGRTYRLANSIGAVGSLNNLATDGYGSGMTMRNINFLQSATNTPILVWDLSTSSNLVAGDGGWGFQSLSFDWTVAPAAGDTESVAFYMAAPAVVAANRDYALIYNSSFRDINFIKGHTGFKTKGKANFWGNKSSNINWYGGWAGPGIDFSEMETYQATAPGNVWDGVYARVDGFTSTAHSIFFNLGLQVDGSIRNVEFNQGVAPIKQYITAGNVRNFGIHHVRLEGGAWSPNYQGFVSLGNPLAGIVVEDISLYNVAISGNGFFVRFPTAGTATDTTLKRFVFDACTLTAATLDGVAGSGSVGEITPVQSLNNTFTGSSWGHIFGDATATTWGINRASRLWTSADRGNNSVTVVPGTDAGVQVFATALTANRTVTLSTSGVANGDEFVVVRTGGGAFTLDVGGLVTFGASQAGAVRVRYVANGSFGGAWTLVSSTIPPNISLIPGLGTGVATLLTGASSGTGGPAGTTAPTFLASVQIGNGTGNPLLYYNGAASSVRGYDIYSNGVQRWRIATTGTESGANAGCDFLFQSFDDAGASLSFPLRVNRAGSSGTGSISLRAPASGSAGAYFPCWTSNPAGTTTEFVQRTAAQVRSDIGAISMARVTGTLVAGTVVIPTTSITAVSIVTPAGQNSSGTHGELTVSARTPGVSITITSTSALDTRLVGCTIVEP